MELRTNNPIIELIVKRLFLIMITPVVILVGAVIGAVKGAIDLLKDVYRGWI